MDLVWPADHLLAKLLIQQLCQFRARTVVSTRQLQPLLSLLNFLPPYISLGRLHMHPLQLWLAACWDHPYLPL